MAGGELKPEKTYDAARWFECRRGNMSENKLDKDLTENGKMNVYISELLDFTRTLKMNSHDSNFLAHMEGFEAGVRTLQKKILCGDFKNE